MRTVESIPSSWFTDPSILRRERAAVFAPHWHYVGSAADVAEANSFMTADLGGLPVVITRDGAGELRALANVCRHRGHLVATGCGRRKTLQCGYHGWTYLLDGRLHKAAGGIEVAPEDGQLPELAVATVGPLLFVCVDRNVTPLTELLAPFLQLAEGVSLIDFDRLVRHRSILHELDANWKIVAENFMECYHCPLVHGDTLPGYGFGNDDYLIESHGMLVTQRFDREKFSWVSLFPNTQISVFGDDRAVVARQLVPDGPGRTRATLDYWFDRDVDEAAVQKYVDWFEVIVGEDIPLCNAVQIGCESGMLDRGQLHPREESGPLQFEELLIAALAGDGE